MFGHTFLSDWLTEHTHRLWRGTAHLSLKLSIRWSIASTRIASLVYRGGLSGVGGFIIVIKYIYIRYTMDLFSLETTVVSNDAIVLGLGDIMKHN